MDPAIFAALVYGILTGTAAIITAVAGFKASKKKDIEDCHEQLIKARLEAEDLSEKLHDIRMRQA